MQEKLEKIAVHIMVSPILNSQYIYFFVHFNRIAYLLWLDLIEKPWQILLINGIKKGFLLS